MDVRWIETCLLRLAREVRVANDANCFAVSEATDGAAAGAQVVFGVILGTGCGGGVAIGGRVHAGPNGVAGEWGHNPLPWPKPEEYPGPACYCGKRGCMEMWVSGTGHCAGLREGYGKTRCTTQEIMQDFESGEPQAVAAVERFEDRLARGLAQVINILDPDVIVVGGGVSSVKHIYEAVPKILPTYVFGGEVSTPCCAGEIWRLERSSRCGMAVAELMKWRDIHVCGYAILE